MYKNMKKYYSFALLGAIALTGAVFTACSSDDDLANVNPTFDGQAVKTSFTISVGDVKSTTRMEADPVQQDELFNGMTDIYLFPAKETITATTTTSESYIKLPDFSAFSSQVLKAQGKIYTDVAFSVGVNNFLFYAASALPGTGKLKASYLGMPATEFNGTTDWDPEPILTTSKVGDVHFDLVPIQKEKTLDDVKTAGAATIAPLNAVDEAITAQISAADAAAAAAAVTELQKLQKTLRNDISAEGASTPVYHPYAGSSLSQKALMTKVYTAVKNLETLITATYTAPIIAAIEASFSVTGDADAGFTLTWKTDPKFPSDDTVLGVPDGAAAVQFDGTKFDFVEPSVDGLSVPHISNYVFPPSLYYTINTPSMVKDAEYLSTLTDQYTTWADVKTNGAYTEGAVTAATRSVIMKDQVQYAVGRLDVQVRVKPSATILDSGSKDLVDETTGNPVPQPVTVPGNGYKLTGVLIGGQKNVDWQFLPVNSSPVYTIWDKKMNSEIFAKQQAEYSAANYTLAMETVEDEVIRIALEFENTGNDFYGIEHNIIPAGTKFYLVAALDPSTNTTYKVQDPETPWAAGTDLIKQVFKQDYVTTAKLTIHEDALKSAYNVVPDLRSPKLEFGLSVDLHWRTGITFEQNFQ